MDYNKKRGNYVLTKLKKKTVSFREVNIKYSKRKKKLTNACFLKYKITTLFVSHGYHVAP